MLSIPNQIPDMLLQQRRSLRAWGIKKVYDMIEEKEKGGSSFVSGMHAENVPLLPAVERNEVCGCDKTSRNKMKKLFI